MREIKFRAWETHAAEWDTDGRVTKSYSGMDYGPWNSESGNINEIFIGQEGENRIFMQYTGLHDKNGKEIYEGDIVKRSDISSFGQNEPVEWSDGIDSDGIVSSGFSLNVFSENDIEVIGNIYENANLLDTTLGHRQGDVSG